MKSIFKTAVLVLTLAFTAVSCSSDDDNNDTEEVAESRDVKYEITGNFTGELDATYSERSGAPLIEDVPSLPWTKEFTANPDSNGVLLRTGGGGGVAGQTVTAKIYVGGKVVSELTGTANSEGIIVVHPNPYVFPR